MDDFNNLLDIVSQLRKECPWDKEQTHESLAKHLIEESYELLDTLSNLNDSPESFNDFKEELGDLLLQILLHSEIASENNLSKNNYFLKQFLNVKVFGVRDLLTLL